MAAGCTQTLVFDTCRADLLLFIWSYKNSLKFVYLRQMNKLLISVVLQTNDTQQAKVTRLSLHFLQMAAKDAVRWKHKRH